MASLTGNAINTSYQGLIKLTDNAGLDATLKQVTDGVGTNAPIKISTGGVTFDTGSTVDFTGVTVNGLPSEAGLVSGTGADSMVSSSSLTTTGASGGGADTIALGDEAVAGSVGRDGAVAIGLRSKSEFATLGVALGPDTTASGSQAVSIGWSSTASATNSISIGRQTSASSSYAVTVGRSSSATAQGSVSLGYQVTNNRANTVAGQQFEAKTAGQGIIVTSPDGLTTVGIGIDNSGNITTYAV